jgi:SAM-dependent methyltransferase
MAAQDPKPEEFRAGQRKNWDTAAEGWRKWSDLIDSTATHVRGGLVELAGVEAGSRVLDVAAGYGEPSLTAARAAGPDGKVVATDISAGMLEYGRERAREAGLDNIEFVEIEASALDFPEGSFDAALSSWGIIFEPDAEAVAAKVRGFLRPGCRMAISAWGTPDEVPFLGLPMRTVVRQLGVAPPPPGTPGPMSRPTPEAIGGLLEAGGFTGVEVERTQVDYHWSSAAEFTTFVREIAPPIRNLMADRPPEEQEAAWSAVTDAAQEFAGDDGVVRMSNVVLLAAGSA